MFCRFSFVWLKTTNSESTRLLCFIYLVCTPYGFVRLFGVVNQVLVRPMLLRDVNEEFSVFYMEEASVKRKLAHIELHNVSVSQNGHGNGRSHSYITAQPLLSQSNSLSHLYQRKPLHGNVDEQQELLNERLRELYSERKELDKLRKSSTFQRTFVYPLAMLLLLFCTAVTILLVVQNTLELLIGIKALPLSTRVSQLQLKDTQQFLIWFSIILAIYTGHIITVEAGPSWRRVGGVSHLLSGRHLGCWLLQHALHEQCASKAASDIAATADVELRLHAGLVLRAATAKQDYR